MCYDSGEVERGGTKEGVLAYNEVEGKWTCVLGSACPSPYHDFDGEADGALRARARLSPRYKSQEANRIRRRVNYQNSVIVELGNTSIVMVWY